MKRFCEKISSIKNKVSYNILVEGNVDQGNCFLYAHRKGIHSRKEIVFQPTKSLKIKNIGNGNLINPVVITNNSLGFACMDSLLGYLINRDDSDKNKALKIFSFFASNDVQTHDNHMRYGEMNIIENDEKASESYLVRSNPVHSLNSYYCSGCSLTVANMAAVCNRAGLVSRPLILSDVGNGTVREHAVLEVFYENSYHLFDPEARTFFVNESGNIASFQEFSENPELLSCSHIHGPASSNFASEYSKARIYKEVTNPSALTVLDIVNPVELTLRPNEEITYYWDEGDEFCYIAKTDYHKPMKPWGLVNPVIRSFPDFSTEQWRLYTCFSENISNSSRGEMPTLMATDEYVDGRVRFYVATTYPIVSSQLLFDLTSTNGNPAIAIYVSDNTYSSELIQEIDSNGAVSINISNGIKLIDSLNKNFIYIDIIFKKGKTSKISNLSIETTLQANLYNLPSLSCGTNVIDFSHQSNHRVDFELLYSWEELEESLPLPPVLHYVEGKISWENENENEKIEIKCCIDKTMKLICSPELNRVINVSPNDIEFSSVNKVSSNKYYVAARFCNKNNLWSKWSNTLIINSI
ncbi:hypothetical protein VCRA2116O29_400034 [Vibrio crassostreae]|nr:hypothetical protein VCRA2116O29_400034 [Vibrio crassostreae]CAK3797948.1 hypothetical protein VCRA2123O74_360034 [Vibrio crassostreae]